MGVQLVPAGCRQCPLFVWSPLYFKQWGGGGVRDGWGVGGGGVGGWV